MRMVATLETTPVMRGNSLHDSEALRRCSSLWRSLVTKLTHEIDHLESTVARLKPKELDGDSYTTRDMLLNAIIHAKPYHGLRS